MKKRTFYLGGAALVAVVTFMFASCSQEDDFIINNGLDIDSQVPMTRSADGDQSIGIPDTSRNIPVFEDECGMYALVSMAIDQGIGIKYKDSKGNVRERKIGKDYPAYNAYIDIKKLVPSYEGGRMTEAELLSAGIQAGILSGRVESYRSDEELREALDSEFHKGDKEWRRTHGKGKYIILNPRDSEKGHYSVGSGIKNGSLRYQDSTFNRDAVGSSYGSYSLRDNDKNDDNKEVRWIVFYME